MRKNKVLIEFPAQRAAEPVPARNESGVRALIHKFEGKIGSETEISVSEYIRLVQLERELQSEEPSDIEVRWIDRLEDPSNGAD